MKSSMTLRKQMTIFTTALMLLQSIALILGLIFSGVFTVLDSEAFKTLGSVTTSKAELVDEVFKALVKQGSHSAELINNSIQKSAVEAGVPTEAIYLNDELYSKIAIDCGREMMKLLSSYQLAGAFLIFEGSNVRKDEINAHSAIYIRNTDINNYTEPSSYRLEVGDLEIAKDNHINTSFRWEPDMELVDIGSEKFDYYSKPMMARISNNMTHIEQYGYWSKPHDVFNNGLETISYTLPLSDDKGVPYAVFGIEMETHTIADAVLSIEKMPYSNSFYLITDLQNNAIDLDWYMSSRPLLKTYLTSDDSLKIRRVPKTELYEANLNLLGAMYCDVRTINMYGTSSVFKDYGWKLISFAPKHQLQSSSTAISNMLVIVITLITVLSVAVSYLAAKLSMKKIEGLSSYVEGLGAYQEIAFKRTGLREIDDLMNSVESLNRDIINSAKNTSNIFELSSLPIGGFEVRHDINQTILTGFIIKLLNLGDNHIVSNDEWYEYYEELVSRRLEDNIYEYIDINSGQVKYLHIDSKATELGRVGVVMDVSKDLKEKKRLEYMLEHDELTGLYSREAFKRKAFDLIKNEPDKFGAMLFSDLDNLKYINDTFGHDVGDEFIKMASNMYLSFEEYGAVVARISGDEFAIYIHGYDSRQALQSDVYSKLKNESGYIFKTPDGVERRIRASTGIAWYPDDSKDIIELMKLSDYAMYEIKHSDKGGFSEFNSSSYSDSAYLRDNRDSINVLLDEERIRFAYQPIVDLKTGEIFAYEMLMRPTIDDFKSPLEVLNVAKNQSKLARLEKVIMFNAFKGIRHNYDQLGKARIFINSIPSQMLSEEDMWQLAQEYGDLFFRVVMEVIEIESDSPEKMQAKIKMAREMGMMLAIDDFGSGYSNEMRILSSQPDIIKIDMELIRGIHKDPDKRVLVTNLVRFCHTRESRVVAEGVEDKYDLKALIEIGVDFVQGYYTGRPNFEVKDIEESIKEEIRAYYYEEKVDWMI